MRRMNHRLTVVFMLSSACLVAPVFSQDQSHAVHRTLANKRSAAKPGGGWLEAWEHRHVSPNGTPYVHVFGFEPAFFDRGLFFDYHQTTSADRTEDESEFEVELEWAFTKRLGVVVELPYARIDETGGDSRTGIGDIAVAPRALLVDTDDFLLSANLEVGMSTGDDNRGLGSGETTLAPSFSCWADLGNWVTLQAQIGTEHGLESGDTELSYKSAMTWSFLTSPTSDPQSVHYQAGMTSLLAEFTSHTVLDGGEETRTSSEVLFGVSYSLSEHWQVRTGYQFPVGGPEDIDHSFVIGAVLHF